MRWVRWMCIAGLVVLVASPTAAAVTVAYTNFDNECHAGGLVPLADCTVTHSGAMLVTAANCDADSCLVLVDGSAVGTSTLPGPIAVVSEILDVADPNNAVTICQAGEDVGNHVNCDGSAIFDFPLVAGECRALRVHSSTTVDILAFDVEVLNQFDVCRDLAGNPDFNL